MNIVFASDHAGIELREELASYAKESGYSVHVVGAPSSESYDYPDAADLGAELIRTGEADMGVFICGSGTGICIRANRFPFLRAANCHSVEMAELARQHNHANVLCLGERMTDTILARAIFDIFVQTEGDSGERHLRRIEKLGTPISG
jgi:ribose 5-phosphate isomerase B